jgi:hypothetical protein
MSPLLLLLLLAAAVAPTQSATFVVTTEADTGAGSLREAIISANTAAGVDEVRYLLLHA